MKMPRSRALTAFCAAATLSLGACGGGGEERAVPSAPDERLVGLWDLTYVDPQDGQDILYYEIGAEGRLTVFDYMGDAHDAGDDCHVRFDFAMTRVAGDRYRVEIDPEAAIEEQQLVDLQAADGWLRASFPGGADAEGVMPETYPRLDGLDPASLALCEL